MSDTSNDGALLLIGLVVGAAIMLTFGSIAVPAMQEDIAVKYGIGGYDQKTGEFSYFEERKCPPQLYKDEGNE